MAQRVREAGFPLAVWARRREAAQVLIDQGADWSESPEALAGRCDVVVTMLTGPADVIDVHRRMLPHARQDAIFIDMTTAAPKTARELAALAPGADVAQLDCPVTGGVTAARQGKLTVFVGSEADVLARCRTVLQTLGERIVHCGASGSGYRMKLVNQTIMAGALLGIAEGAALARASGLDAAAVVDALGTGTASGPLFHSYLPRMVVPSGAVTFTLGMLRKDLELARDEAVVWGSSTRLLAFALASVDEACRRFGVGAGVQHLAVLDSK